MGVGRPVDGMGDVHPLLAEGRRGVFDQSDVIPQLHAEAAGRLNAGVGDQTDQDDAADAVLPQLQIEIGVGEAARSPARAVEITSCR